MTSSPHVPPAPISKSWSHQWVQTMWGSSPDWRADDIPNWQVDFSSTITPQGESSPWLSPFQVLPGAVCVQAVLTCSVESVSSTHRVSHRNTVTKKAVFSFPYDQGSQLQSSALMQNFSRRAIKYLGWEAPASTKNTSMLTGVMGSASIWELYKPSPECHTTQNQRVFPQSKIQSKVPTFVSWWVQVPTLIHAWQEEKKKLLIFSTLFSVCD